MADEADSGVRQLVLTHGRVRAKTMVEPEKKTLVDIAAQVLGDEEGKIGISYSGFCLTGLPHKALPSDQVWEKRGHRVTLQVAPLKTLIKGGHPYYIGVPYGARARMILLYLQTQAIRTGSREVELGRSMRDWLGRMGLSWGGKTGAALHEQAIRIATCNLRFSWEGDEADGWVKGGFIKAGLHLHDRSPANTQQGSLWADHVILDETFYEALQRHPVPLREAAIRALAGRSLSLDIYIWLAYRLHSLKRSTSVRWAALNDQFGGTYTRRRDFVRDFRKALAPAVTAYPEARVEFEDEGLLLYPSQPPIRPRLIAMNATVR